MFKVGNIISDTELFEHDKVDYLNYATYDDVKEMDINLPTLFVGWNILKEKYLSQLPKEVSILDKKIVKNKLYWEFSFKENKSQHIAGVDEFMKNSPDHYFSERWKYTNLDPVMFCIDSIEDIFLICKDVDGVYQHKDDMLYIMSGETIVGLDLEMYGFFDFPVQTIIDRLKEKTPNYYLDQEGETFQMYYKQFPYFENLRRYIVVLLSNS